MLAPAPPTEGRQRRRGSTHLMTREEIQLRILRLLQDNPQLSQRDLAAELGVSVGRTHYCLKALVSKGWVKAGNFAKSSQKRSYLYKLTPTGIVEKAAITQRFLQRKMAEHAALVEEIELLQRELETNAAGAAFEASSQDTEAEQPAAYGPNSKQT